MKRLAYLSGAVRVSTADHADAGGPRSHVLGVIGGFERNGWRVERAIAGDRRCMRPLGRNGLEESVRASRAKAVAADGVRVATGVVNRAMLPRGRFDLAYERFGSFQRLGRGLQRRGVPWVLETSGPFFHEARAERGTLALTSLARRVELGAYDRCDVLVCVSESLRELLAGQGVRTDHMVVVPNAADVARFDPAAHRPVKPDHLVVGFVGTVLAWQGIGTLVEALAILRGRGVTVSAVVVGDGPALEGLRAQAAELGVADRVQLAGQVAAGEIPERIAAFDVGYSGHLPLLDGHMYHSPLKLYEYLAMNVPLVAADHPEARALVAGSGAGALFPAGDAAALADALAAIDVSAVRDCDVRTYAVANHSWDRRVRDLLDELGRRGL